jgi:hypothetical protein
MVVVVAALAGRRGLAHATDRPLSGRFDLYLHRTDGQLADPINLVFRGTLAEAAAAVPQVLGWKNVQGSPMLFYDHGRQLQTAAQFGFDLGGGSRYHIRLQAVQADNGRSYVLAGVHRDDMTACGHVGHVFSAARDIVADGFAAAGYHVSTLRLGNVEPGRQCDGTLSAGDGTAALIDLTRPPATSLPGGPLLPLSPLAP